MIRTDPEALLSQAQAALAAGEIEAAQALLGDALSDGTDPPSPALLGAFAAAAEAQAAALEQAGRTEAGARVYDLALAAAPGRQAAAEGRARIALQHSDSDAAEHCRRALSFHEGNPDLQFKMIVTAAVELGPAAIPLLEDYVRRHPGSAAAHERLADLRAQSGAGDAFADSFVEALRARPGDRALQRSYWTTLSRAGRHEEALRAIDAGRATYGGDRAQALLEASIALHAGDTERAGALLDRLDGQADVLLARGQHRLQTQRPDEAARFLQSAVQANPEDLSGWALLALAWRLTDDPRHDWLCGQHGLFGSYHLGLAAEELTALASVLRRLHRSRAHPIGQSVRGGTQTAGLLFLRPEPEIARLVEALTDAVRRHVSQLPARDPRHPLLRHRNSDLAFAASWSVRLTKGGFHVAHLHPAGVMSSACHISLPEGLGKSAEQEGWLEIGRPPGELGLDLPPLATIEPKVGRLVLFPSYVFHGTRPFRGGERLTVAFDVAAVR